LEAVISWKNARFLEDMSKSIRRGQQYLINIHHAWPCGPSPTGYRKTYIEIGKRRDGTPHFVPKLEPDPDIAPRVAQAFEMRTNGKTYQEIHEATHLFKHLANYERLLRNRIYTGDLQQDDRLIEGYCPPLVEPTVWEMAQQVNIARRERTASNQPRSVRSRFVLSGLLFCSHCGYGMRAVVNVVRGKRYDYYGCRSWAINALCGALYIPKVELEELVIATLLDRVFDETVLKDLYEAVQLEAGKLAETQSRNLERTRGELGEVQARIGRVVAAISASGHSQALINELAELEKQEHELREGIARMEATTESLPAIDLAHVAETARLVLLTGTDEERTQVVRGFVSKVVAQKVDGRILGELTYYLPGIETQKTIPVNS
jgi:hypothetical protein